MLAPPPVVPLLVNTSTTYSGKLQSREYIWGITMFISLLRSHLPWVVPTAAIVFAASTGFFDRSGSTEQVTQAPAQVAYDINAQAQAAPRVASGTFQPTEQDQIDDADVVTRLSVVTDSSLQALQP